MNAAAVKTLAGILAVAILASGCAHTVEYDLSQQDKVSGKKISQVVEVKKFMDSIPKRTEGVVVIDGEDWRTNPQRGYKNEDVAGSVTTMVARHLGHSDLFTGVVCKEAKEKPKKDPGEPSLILTGTITEYSVFGKVNELGETTSGVASMFGLAGALAGLAANSDENTELRVKVELKNLELKDVKTGKVLWRDYIAVNKHITEDFEAAHPQAVYNYADEGLKEAVDQMIKRMSAQLAR